VGGILSCLLLKCANAGEGEATLLPTQPVSLRKFLLPRLLQAPLAPLPFRQGGCCCGYCSYAPRYAAADVAEGV
jgi:hypothetical protein